MCVLNLYSLQSQKVFLLRKKNNLSETDCFTKCHSPKPLIQESLSFTRHIDVLSGDVVPPDTFNPRDLSTDQWVKAASSFGAKYIVLTLDHFSGFLLWPSATYNYSVKSTKWRQGRGDVTSDFIQSCEKQNVEHGFFYSVNKNWFMNVENFKTKSPKKQKEYNEIVLQQLRELFKNGSKYSNPFYIWFDAGTNPVVNPSIGPLIRSLAKDAICDECKSFAGDQGLRWVGNENAVAPLPNWYAVPTGKCEYCVKRIGSHFNVMTLSYRVRIMKI